MALSTIGPAVLNGGLTTFLALVLGSFSTGHVLLTTFKSFTLIAVFGLFHGLVFFPVVLATLGPVDELQTGSSNDTPPVKNNLGFEEETKKTEGDLDNC